jgi:hypothetical protein
LDLREAALQNLDGVLEVLCIMGEAKCGAQGGMQRLVRLLEFVELNAVLRAEI